MAEFNKNTEDLSSIKDDLQGKSWLVACLCAAWCDTCLAYRSQFDALIAQHPNKCFAWIDIEDQAHLVDEVDIENFPTILIQYEEHVLFFGTMLPDAGQLNRLLNSFSVSLNESNNQKIATTSTSLNQDVPADWNLRRLILDN